MSGPDHIAVVGCGFAGTSALFQLVDRYPVKRITVFEATGVFGPGYPYRTDECPDYLINNTTDTMCLMPQNRQAFINWLDATGTAGKVDRKGHLPRALFGAFLEDTVRTARTIAAIKGITLDLIPAEVTGLTETRAGVEVAYDGGTVSTDAVLLTTGRCPDKDRFSDAVGKAENFFPTHVSSAELDGISSDACVYVLGTSLSAYDIVNRLFSPDTGCRFEREKDGSLRYRPGPNGRRIILGSRGGRLKKMQSRHLMQINRRHFTLSAFRQLAAEQGGLTLDALADMVKAEATAHGADVDWQCVAEPYVECKDGDALNRRAGEILAGDIAAACADGAANFLVDMFSDAQLDIWDGFAERLMTPLAEKRYRMELETAFLTFGAPCPVPTAERLLALHKAKILSVRAGVGVPLRAEGGAGFHVPHRFGEDRVDTVIDASGGVNRMVGDAGQSALVAGLAQSGLMRSYELAGEAMPGADIDMQTFRLRGARNIYACNMWLWGPGFFTSSAFLMASFGQRILDRLYSE
ncbi:FAD/NAD(P)-binding protein [Hwanghaeella sp.]|uniref:FAD/NAD(P)-binding protein n=1 Tax=Hwanghaeella sp. TaxID=2605943 RepID=UPI003CCC0CA3